MASRDAIDDAVANSQRSETETAMIDKIYQPPEVEGRIYAVWEGAGAFRSGRPLAHDGAVRDVDTGEASLGIRRRFAQRGLRRHHRFQERKGDGMYTGMTEWIN